MDGENFNFLQAKHYYLDAPKEPRGTCFVLQVDFARVTERLSDEWASNQALMKLLSDEKHKVAALEARCRELEAALKLVACNCNGEAGCKSYELYYKLCPASKTVVKP